jgi:hypothetical protein
MATAKALTKTVGVARRGMESKHHEIESSKSHRH